MKRHLITAWIFALSLLTVYPAFAIEQVSGEVPMQTAAVAVGNGTPLSVLGYNTASVELSIETTATVTWEGSNGTSWYAIPCTNKTSAASANTATASGAYVCDVAGLKTFRARISAWTSGAVSARGQATTAKLSGSSSTSGGAGDASAANQTTQITAEQAIQAAVETLDNAIGVEDAAETAGGGLAMAGSVRRDTAASSAGTTGDNATLNTDATGRLWTNPSYLGVEDAAETAGGTLAMVGCVRRDTAASSSTTDGDNSTCNTDATGKIWVNPSYLGVEDAAETAAGNLAMVGTVRRDSMASSAGTTGDNATLNTDANGRLWINPSTNGTEDVAETAGQNLEMVGSVRRDTPASSAGTTGDNATINTNADGGLWTTPVASPGGGASLAHRVSVGTTEDETEIKATAGTLYNINVTNTNAAVRYVRCANLTAANTTPGTSTVFFGGAVPGATTGDGINFSFGPTGVAFSTALTCWMVTGAAETDVAEVAANELTWNITYK